LCEAQSPIKKQKLFLKKVYAGEGIDHVVDFLLCETTTQIANRKIGMKLREKFVLIRGGALRKNIIIFKMGYL
jgi:hypothetical protein